ncbi:glycogen/starch/alpha-glucan phosphorylase [Clostridium sp. 19966]|uniref:glycogen/starch/alpha-glucan phosphorylase n=1 Tax=Clostridium sp. 19966 TaxID=2768166 RepID=UPI0028DF7259|nr:glycogen/starch/alpha-glucan phosphorylase [Clostridium sp. 19966]MDT8719497.1 glycogen/starch/alpha-glucan phosphorylase [Clostridium sp. 19966]
MYIDKETFKRDYKKKITTMFSEDVEESSELHKYQALAALIKEYAAENIVKTRKQYVEKQEKQVYYFSMEFLIGRLLMSNLINLGIQDVCEKALKELGIDLKELEDQETDAGLGNGGLGRLAACFLDSMASLGIAGNGCGIRYNYGLFEQKIIDGYQVEIPDNWLKDGNIWEIRKENKAVEVRFGGTVETKYENNKLSFVHKNYEPIIAVPYDMPIIGYKNNTVNTLRLWSAEPVGREFDFSSFSNGDYSKAVEYKSWVESISQILYPDDSKVEGRILRLKQQYFFVSAGMQSIIRSYKKLNLPMQRLDEHIAIHINDTHPSVAVAELMRILVDEEGMSWDEAWRITTHTMAYTNHTILSEALEKWSVDMFKKILPRIYMIVEEINRRFIEELRAKYPNDEQRIRNMAIVQDGTVRMAHLAIVGSHSVNGVAKLHTEILKKQELSNFYNYFPDKFNNKTNGITHRRWLIQANPGLTKVVSSAIGTKWIYMPTELRRLMSYSKDKNFQEKIAQVKLDNKIDFSNYIKNHYNIDVDPNSIFDVQVKRLHAYKRQLMNLFNIMDLYNRLKENPDLDIVPRTFLFGAKAAPGYYLAKQIIKLINTVANKINNDMSIKGKIKIVFLENYRVSLAEKIIPAADLSEQISTTTKEASGTSNMKFMMNGAVTIATLDGANIEIKDEVGDDNIVIFGMRDYEVLNYYKNGGYSAMECYNNDVRLKKIIDSLIDGSLGVSPSEFRMIYDSLLYQNDEYFVLKDFDSYVNAQNRVDELYKNRAKWNEMCISNIANSGVFASDHTIMEYSKNIWNTKPCIIL